MTYISMKLIEKTIKTDTYSIRRLLPNKRLLSRGHDNTINKNMEQKSVELSLRSVLRHSVLHILDAFLFPDSHLYFFECSRPILDI